MLPGTMTQLWAGGSPGKEPWQVPVVSVWLQLSAWVPVGGVGVCVHSHVLHVHTYVWCGCVCVHTHMVCMHACALASKQSCAEADVCVVCRSSAAPVPPPLQLWCGGGGGVPQLEGGHCTGLSWQGEGTLPGEGELRVVRRRMQSRRGRVGNRCVVSTYRLHVNFCWFYEYFIHWWVYVHSAGFNCLCEVYELICMYIV